jgi:1,4-dihydroxy-2-naphthoate octaprenyltransferase
MMIFRTLLKPIKPFPLVSLLAMYALGGGLVQYLEGMRSWPVFIQGAVFLLLWILAFDELALVSHLRDRKKWPDGMTLQAARQTRWSAAIISATLLTVAVTVFINWMVAGIVWQGLAFLVFGFILFVVLQYLSRLIPGVAPYRLLLETLVIAVSPPAMAFFLQSQEYHPFLSFVVLGLVPFYLAYRVLEPLKNFGRDQASERPTIVTALGWDRVMTLHNGLILVGFLVMALIALLGFPWFMLWPVFLTFPIALLEIWLMERVRRGAKPLWTVMSFAAASVFFIPLYLLGFAFWIR